jgi:hypothetical protein
MRNYELDKTDFFRSLEERCIQKGYTLSKYLRRDLTWMQTEEIMIPEIMIPEAIGPEHLLGHWNGSNWLNWKKPQDNETEERLQYLLSQLRISS